jgi:hypothetical protein
MAKVIPTQMPFGLNRLVEPYGAIKRSAAHSVEWVRPSLSVLLVMMAVVDNRDDALHPRRTATALG